MKKKILGQPIVIKERKGGKMVTGKKGRRGQVGRRVKGRKEETPTKKRGSSIFLCTKVICK
jgi:hypothetical protein